MQGEHISTQFYKAKFTNPVNNGTIILDIQSMKFKVQAGDQQISVDSNLSEDVDVMSYNGRDFEMKAVNFWKKEKSLVLRNWR